MRPTIFLAFAACTGDNYNYQGTPIYDYFPLDGTERSWRYSQDDDSIQYFLHVEMVTPSRTVDGVEIHPLETTRSDSKELIATTEWSSDSRAGIMIHSYAVGLDAATTFDPPIVFADPEMAAGDTVETTNASGKFTASFVGLEDCPNHWVSGDDGGEVWNCAHMELTGPGLGFEGDYWIAPRWGTALFQRIQDPDKWNLLEAIWVAE